jgi:uncharacterized membrane protein (UPF0136 family)
MYILTFIYIAFLLTGSFIGYYKAGSVASLVMGFIFATLMTLLTLLRRKGNNWAGHALLGVVLALDCFFSWRYIKTQALIPSGVFSIFTSILLIVIYLTLKKRN